MKTIFGTILLVGLVVMSILSGDTESTGLDGVIESLFEQKIFLIAFGLMLYYVIIWSMARNKAGNKAKIAKDVALEHAETKEQRDAINADPQYKHPLNFKEWFHDQKDEMLVAALSSLLLIEFDDVVIELIEQKFNFTVDSSSNWIYLAGGVLGDLLYRTISKIRHG